MLLAVFVFLLVFILDVVLSIFVWNDAKITKLSNPFIRSFVMFFTFIFMFPVYLYVQYRKFGSKYFDNTLRCVMVIVYFSSVILFGLMQTDAYQRRVLSDSSLSSSQSLQKKKPYTIVDEHVGHDLGMVCIYGTFIPDKPMTFVYIEARIYDSNGSVIGYTNDSINGLAKGEKWTFKMHVTEKNAYNYKITNVRFH